MPSELLISELAGADVDGVWAFLQHVPERDRTFVKEPVIGRETIRGWADGDRATRCVALLDERVVGYVALFPGVGWSRHVGELRLVVDPAFRGQGIGQRLVRHALTVAVNTGLTKVVVEVVAEQESTIAVFKRLGFRVEALLENHVQDQDGRFGDLIVLANHIDVDWQLLATVGLDEPLD